jgi:hypothetical protein
MKLSESEKKLPRDATLERGAFLRQELPPASVRSSFRCADRFSCSRLLCVGRMCPAVLPPVEAVPIPVLVDKHAVPHEVQGVTLVASCVLMFAVMLKGSCLFTGAWDITPLISAQFIHRIWFAGRN